MHDLQQRRRLLAKHLQPPAIQTQSGRGISIKICCAPPQRSKCPPRPPAWPSPSPIARLAAEGGRADFFSAPPGHTQSGDEPLTNVSAAHVLASAHPVQIPPPGSSPLELCAIEGGVPGKIFAAPPASGRNITAGGRSPYSPTGGGPVAAPTPSVASPSPPTRCSVNRPPHPPPNLHRGSQGGAGPQWA